MFSPSPSPSRKPSKIVTDSPSPRVLSTLLYFCCHPHYRLCIPFMHPVSKTTSALRHIAYCFLHNSPRFFSSIHPCLH